MRESFNQIDNDNYESYKTIAALSVIIFLVVTK